jgi:SAM-dependent methyltransferase
MNVYLEEYSADEAVQKYVSDTAGSGIAYLLEHVYGRIYKDQINKLVAESGDKRAFRILEYGCGGGMNLIWIVRHLFDRRLELNLACGTDFSQKMIEAATKEGSSALPSSERSKVSFYPVANENLSRDLPKEMNQSLADLKGSFDLIVGVNTFRYCFRLGKQTDCANDIFSLLRPGGRSVMIDMNRYYPLFRTRLRDRLTKPEEERYLPTLDEYASAFRKAGFEIETKKNFCWVPHSAGGATLAAFKTLSPVLQLCLSHFAMRSLVIGRKPR